MDVTKITTETEAGAQKPGHGSLSFTKAAATILLIISSNAGQSSSLNIRLSSIFPIKSLLSDQTLNMQKTKHMATFWLLLLVLLQLLQVTKCLQCPVMSWHWLDQCC